MRFERSADFSVSRFLEAGILFKGDVQTPHELFATARFSRLIIFSDTKFPVAEIDWRRAFSGALFEYTFDLQGVDQKTVSSLSGATINRGVLLTRNSELDDNVLHAQALRLALEAEDREDALRALEGGAQKLEACDGTRQRQIARATLLPARASFPSKAIWYPLDGEALLRPLCRNGELRCQHRAPLSSCFL